MSGSDVAARYADVTDFVRDLTFADLPADVVALAQRCVLDLTGVAAAGSRTAGAALVNAYAVRQLAGRDRDARILFDGRRAGLAGAAFAGATTIDAFDAHDGHVLTKGHAGVAILPALLAALDGGIGPREDGREFLTSVVAGYEIATRAGIALHATVDDYHCSGAWNALACAALVGRWLGLDRERLRHALGIAEYFGPRGQILRVCDTPSMLKDGSGWGAHAGVTAALLASEGFTGAPAVTVERDDARPLFDDLGTRWCLREQYFKAYPVCRWAQPAVEATLALMRTHSIRADDVAAIAIESFREAIDLGAHCKYPKTTDEAQYSLPYPVAAVLVHGKLGAAELAPEALADRRVRRLLDTTTLTVDDAFSRRFPAERWARVRIELRGGAVLVSEPARARGNPENPLSDGELRAKFRELAGPVIGAGRATRIEALVDGLATDGVTLQPLLDEWLTPP